MLPIQWTSNYSITDGFEISCFKKIFRFLEWILTEHIENKNSLESKLQMDSFCSVRIRSRIWNIFKKPLQLISNPSGSYKKKNDKLKNCLINTWLSLRVLLVDCELDRVPSPPPPPPLSRELFPPIFINTSDCCPFLLNYFIFFNF